MINKGFTIAEYEAMTKKTIELCRNIIEGEQPVLTKAEFTKPVFSDELLAACKAYDGDDGSNSMPLVYDIKQAVMEIYRGMK